MASNPENPPPSPEEDNQDAAAIALQEAPVVDPLSENYGDVNFNDIRSKVSRGRQWNTVKSLTEEMEGDEVLLRVRVHSIRARSKKVAFVVVRELGYTVQCVLVIAPDLVSQQMLKFATSLSKESIIAVNGVVSVPSESVKGTSQQVEVQVRSIYCISRCVPKLPINIEDAARSEADINKAKADVKQAEADIEKAKADLKNARSEADIKNAKDDIQKAETDLRKASKKSIRVNIDTCLNNRVIHLQTPANSAIFRLKHHVVEEFMCFLSSEGFIGITTPKIIPGSSEGGAAVFKLDYMGTPACLAQSPQLYKQMAICANMGRVFEVGAVYRAERSFTNRHLCEFTGLDVEMEIIEHYSEVMDLVDRLFVSMFDNLTLKCKAELEDINKQFPFEPLKYLRTTLRLTFQEGLEMLKEAGVEVDPYGDLDTRAEAKLGELVLEKYGTEFYMLHKYPLAVRPFYTMPCYEDELYSNSFDVFIRGKEIISGAQRIHDPDLLTKRAMACGIDVKSISYYFDSFRYGAPPHGGFGAGLERVVMLFCGLKEIRMTSMFPRDPHRLSP